MLEKLAAIADYADRNGHHEVANDLTYLVKNAQLFDALRTLFDPSSSELDQNSSFWKRLTRGFQRGKFDRRLGLALAINAERTKLNKKIEQLSAPLKDFSAQVNAFYDKVKSGGENYGAMDFKAELAKLKSDAAKMKGLIGGRDLRKALDMRNKLNAQQISAVEKIKGIDPEHKDFLIKLLNGEIKQTSPEAAKKEEAAGGASAAAKKTTQEKAIADWLKMQDISRRPYDDGFTTSRSAKRAAIMFQRYGFNPFAVLDFFKEHPEKREEGVELFGHALRKLFDDLNWGVDLEKTREKETPGAEPAKEEAKSVVTPPPGTSTTPGAGPAVLSPAPSAEPTKSAPAPTSAPKKREKTSPETLENIRKVDEFLKNKAKGKGKGKEPLPEEKTPRAQPEIASIPVPKSPASDLAVSVAARTERQITRLGRVRQLTKLAEDEDILDVLDPVGLEGEDMMDTGLGEEFDEDKHVDEEQLESFKGREPDEDLGSWDSESDPEDEDDFPQHERRREPMRMKGKEEQLDDVMELLRMVEKRIERYKSDSIPVANPEYHRWKLRSLEKEKAKLLEMKNELSGLPEGWADDGE